MFEDFIVEIEDITRLAFVPWMSPAELEQEYFADLNSIFGSAQLIPLFPRINLKAFKSLDLKVLFVRNIATD